MDFAVISQNNFLVVTNDTTGLCAVRVTNMSDGTTQYQSSISLGTPSNETTAFTFKIETSAHYMIEAWTYSTSTKKTYSYSCKVCLK